MKRHYDGLEAVKIHLTSADIATSNTNCVAMIQLELVDGVCATPEWGQQITYVGDQG